MSIDDLYLELQDRGDEDINEMLEHVTTLEHELIKLRHYKVNAKGALSSMAIENRELTQNLVDARVENLDLIDELDDQRR